MAYCSDCQREHCAGFISTRFAGTDGVSLETEKWAQVFEKQGFRCVYFAGEVDRPPERSFQVPKAHFKHPEIQDIYRKCFGKRVRERSVTRQIHAVKEALKDQLYRFIESFDIDLLVPENALTIPLNLPLGMALTEVISETGIKTIAHHHDFFWERQHFKTNAVWEYLNMAFPPHLPSILHAVINSSADNQLSFGDRLPRIRALVHLEEVFEDALDLGRLGRGGLVFDVAVRQSPGRDGRAGGGKLDRLRLAVLLNLRAAIGAEGDAGGGWDAVVQCQHLPLDFQRVA